MSNDFILNGDGDSNSGLSGTFGQTCLRQLIFLMLIDFTPYFLTALGAAVKKY